MAAEQIELFPAAETSLGGLRAAIQGRVITPDDPDYDTVRQAWNLLVDQHPALIVVAASASDVAQAVRFARNSGLGVAVQATGHGVVSPADDALLIVTSQMTDVRIDAQSQTAWIEAGTQWGKVLEKAQEVGLAPLLGSSPGVGAVGYTLGGGMGWLARKYGLAADSVRFFEIVTADGQLRRASPTENADLFWGLRGGGGSFGVITGMEVQLYPVTTVYAGNLIYPVDAAHEVFAHYREWVASTPDELTSSILIMNFPPIPAVPEFLRGQSVVMVRGCYVGSVQRGAELIQEWRNWKTPMADMFDVMPFSKAATISNDPVDPMPGLSTTVSLRALDDSVIETLIRYGVTKNGLVVTEIRQAGGAIARVDPEVNAYGNRNTSLILQFIGVTPTLDARHQLGKYVDQIKEELHPHLTDRVYINFLEGREKRERTKDAYSPETYRRLMHLKARYDPENLFRFSFGILPAHDNA
jgi:hypothetical protein